MEISLLFNFLRNSLKKQIEKSYLKIKQLLCVEAPKYSFQTNKVSQYLFFSAYQINRVLWGICLSGYGKVHAAQRAAQAKAKRVGSFHVTFPPMVVLCLVYKNGLSFQVRERMISAFRLKLKLFYTIFEVLLWQPSYSPTL